MSNKIAIIGGGNLGSAIAEGLISSMFVQPEDIIITKRNTATLSALQRMGVQVTDDNKKAIQFADYVILAVKPFQIKEILEQLNQSVLTKKPVLISVITGIWLKDLTDFTSKEP